MLCSIWYWLLLQYFWYPLFSAMYHCAFSCSQIHKLHHFDINWSHHFSFSAHSDSSQFYLHLFPSLRNVLVKIPIRSIFGWIGCAVYQAIHYWPPTIFYIIIFLKSIPLPVFSANFIAIPDVMWVFLNPIFFWNFTDSLN